MNNLQEDCRHQKIPVEEWFGEGRHDYSEAMYWENDRQREIRLLDQMLNETWHQHVHGISQRVQRRPRLERQFDTLADEWRRETAHLSSLTRKITHPSYLRIISLGRDVLPLVLRRLEHEPAYWFVALRALTGQDPVPADTAGNFRATKEAWLEWGRASGLV